MEKDNSIALLIAVCLTMFFNAFMGSSINIAVPYIAEDYAVPPQSVTWMINAFMITTAPFLIGASALANRFGLHRIYVIGAFLATVSSIVIPLCPVFSAIVVARAMQGIIFALIFCTAMALLVYNLQKEKRAFAIGIATGSVYAGLSVSPLIGGIITDTLGWRAIFYLTALGQIVSLYLVRKVKPDTPISNYLSLTKIALSFIAGLVFLVGLSNILYDTRYAFAIVAGLVLLIIYIALELKSKHQLFPLTVLFSNSSLNYQLIASFLNYTSSFAISFLLALHLELIEGYSATQAGIILIAQPAVMMITSVCSGKISQYINKNLMTILGMVILAIGLYMLSLLQSNASMSMIMAAQIICGFGFGIFSAPNTHICMSLVDKSQLANVNALLALSRNLGMAFSMAFITGILYFFIKSQPGTTTYLYELSYSISYAFFISVLICIAGTVFCILAALNYYHKIYKVRYMKD
ncbi:MFS transporter [Anaerobiospirillum thomasii]|uniref:Spectinomycin tetracycline efflux pump n=1 Tax=Anaerobiospirillum thomasii TaxID=179995 RepID=A0A2X0VR21_9GAMM|nr:MFS transporter [Anaerobiospirillum thomasii]SPT70200.1 Spectinomycin tetracycline efflux pump [Anaerobiospirillum thomasii]